MSSSEAMRALLKCVSMLLRRRLSGVLACVLTVVAACKGPSQPGPIRVYPRDGGNGSAKVSVVSASLTEDAVNLTREQLRLELAIANTGAVPVTDVVVQEGRLEVTNLDLALALSLDPASDGSPIAPGETRNLVFDASVVPLGVCTSDLELTPNPHMGLVTIGVTVVSSAGGTALSGIDVAVTCQFTASDLVLQCADSLADACVATDTAGNTILDCKSTYGAALQDTSLCGTGAVDDRDFACPTYTYRVLIIGGIERIYVYQGGTGSAPLVAVLAPGTSRPVCLAGPTSAISIPGCPSVFGSGPFQGESPACSAMDAGMPQPDAGQSPDAPSPPPDAQDQDAGRQDAGTTPPPDGPTVTDAGAQDSPQMMDARGSDSD
jgi:hypothetical protein